jgi:predicted nucleic acid-binding protein
MTFLEVLVGPIRQAQDSLADSYRSVMSRSHGFIVHPLDLEIAEIAAAIRARQGLRTPDSVVAATAIQAKCGFLITNDSVFRRIADLKVLIVEDYL